MNDNQKLSTIAAMGVIILSLVFSPWEETTRYGNTVRTARETVSPIFMPPGSRESGRVQLRSEVLVMEWFAIGIVYAGTFMCFKEPRKKKIFVDDNSN